MRTIAVITGRSPLRRCEMRDATVRDATGRWCDAGSVTLTPAASRDGEGGADPNGVDEVLAATHDSAWQDNGTGHVPIDLRTRADHRAVQLPNDDGIGGDQAG